jgi:hypothetical protein
VRLSGPLCEAEIYKTVEFVTKISPSESIVPDQAAWSFVRTTIESLATGHVHRLLGRPLAVGKVVSRPGNFTSADESNRRFVH